MKRQSPLLGGLAIVALAVGLPVALVIGSAPGGLQATAVELTIQILIVVGALLLVAGRTARS
ncbi:MAG: hypothetical protein M3R21_11325 [Candidatus Dormibacteraeota bacterium]|nr:hypothetical protein [Candidatus Dormibacteraeota bacterium]